MDRLKEEKVFKDPVHKYIYVQEKIIWDLINAKEFQRLRRIRQLGTSYLTFHGAEHSRFSHSLGVYEITRKIINQFVRGGYADWEEEERLLCLCASLLHDVGHGPFSHSVEEVFGTNHEDWSCRIILGDTQINRILSGISPDFAEKVAEVIAKTYPNKLVVGLISSQLDADRMDYLLRDAYYTGVNYGTFDLERILRVLRPYQGHIVVKESGMHAVEDYLMSRYQMYWQVYFHPVTRSAELLLKNIFRRAKHLYDQGYSFAFMLEPLEGLLKGKLTMEQYLQLDEAFILTMMMRWTREKDPILSDLSERFVDRRLLKQISIEYERDPIVGEIRDVLEKRGIDSRYYVEIDFPVDLPYDVYQPGKTDKLPILILDEKGELTEISEKSDIVRSISGVHTGRHYLYFPADFLLKDSGSYSRELRRLLEKYTTS